MTKEEKIAFLNKFRWIDKYATFCKMMPLAGYSTQDQKDIITAILDHCAEALVNIYKSDVRASITTIKQILSTCMDDIARSAVSNVNKDFAYELCWYLAEKCGIDLRKSSDAKIWGFWKVESNKVKTIGSVRKKKAGKVA